MGLEGSAFFRTDNFLRSRPFRWSIALVVVALLAWSSWFFMAPLPLTAASQSAVFSSPNTVIAHFTPDVAMQLNPNQPVTIRLDHFPWQEFGSGNGFVVQIGTQIREEVVEVEIRYQNGLDNLPLQRDLTAQIIILNEEITPAELLWRRLVTDTRQ